MESMNQLHDIDAITRVLNRYCAAVADRDVDALMSLFTDDVYLDFYSFGAPLVGAAAVRQQFGEALAPGRPISPLTEHVASAPFTTNVVVDVDGDHARAQSYCLATHAGRRGDEALVLMNCTINRDQLVRTKTGWKIARREHSKVWSALVPQTYR